MNLKTRMRIERTITRQLVKNLLSADYSVYETSENITHFKTLKEAMNHVMDLDEAEIIGKKGDNIVSFLLVFGNDGYDCIADCSMNGEKFIPNALIQRYEEQYC